MKWFVPGRLEVLGKHTDYAGGRSLLAAVDRGVTADITDLPESGSADDAPTLIARTTAQAGQISLRPGVDPGLPAGHWGRYVQTVLDRLTLNFGQLRPAQVDIDSTLPLASGMSSSSALVTAVALALADHNQLPSTRTWQDSIHDELDLAGYMATVENGLQFKSLPGLRGVGTFGGSEDHTAMLACREGQLTQFTFCPIVRGVSLPLPEEWSFVVAVSGVLAEKTGAALTLYNNVSLRARELVELWNDRTGEHHLFLSDIVATPEGLENLRTLAADNPALAVRLEAFVTESEVLIPAAVAALQTGDLAAFGEAACRSHHAADTLLANQVPQTNALQRLAMDLGAIGSASFGAGFGGSVWALVQTATAEAFAAEWLERYLREYPEVSQAASTLVTRPGAAARRLD